MNKFVIAAAAALLLAGPATAQDWSQNPRYGSVRLSAGFTPDPFTVNLTAGGSIPASSRFSSCRGHIANAPDVRLYWSGGGNLPLIFSVNSSADTTLVINDPAGNWYCDDDSGQGTNPSIRLNNPRSGQYDIWVGSYHNQYVSSTLAISEVTSY